MSIQDRELLPEGEVLEFQFRTRVERGQDQGEQSQNCVHHGPEVSCRKARKVNRINEAGILANDT